jgi:Flp pilus assembly protein CpaB
MPVVEGQILVKSCFVTEGIGALLASQIPHGMRAFTVSVSSKSMPDSILLYPGAVVDVLVYYKLSNSNSEGESLSQTMLIGMKVLAVSGDSVVSKPEEDGGAKKRSSGGRLVTLLVNTKQAEALMLAAEGGSLTMSLRNPLDRELVDKEASVLDRNSIGRKGETIQPTISNEQILPGQWSDGDNPQDQAQSGVVYDPNIPVPQPESTNKSQNSENSSRDIEMIIGRVKTIENVDAPENKTDKTAP